MVFFPLQLHFCAASCEAGAVQPLLAVLAGKSCIVLVVAELRRGATAGSSAHGFSPRCPTSSVRDLLQLAGRLRGVEAVEFPGSACCVCFALPRLGSCTETAIFLAEPPSRPSPHLRSPFSTTPQLILPQPHALPVLVCRISTSCRQTLYLLLSEAIAAPKSRQRVSLFYGYSR